MALRAGEWFKRLWSEGWSEVGLLLLGGEEIQRDLLLCEDDEDCFARIADKGFANEWWTVWQTMLCSGDSQVIVGQKQIVLRYESRNTTEATCLGQFWLERLRLSV